MPNEGSKILINDLIHEIMNHLRLESPKFYQIEDFQSGFSHVDLYFWICIGFANFVVLRETTKILNWIVCSEG